MNAPTTIPPHPLGVSRWKWLLVLGVALMVLGIAGFGVVSFLELTTLLVFGVMLLTSSVLQVLIAFAVENRRESLLHLTAAGLEMALAFFLMMNPPERIIGLITLIAFFLIAIGVARLIRGVMKRSAGRGWILVGGAIALLLGGYLWVDGATAKLSIVGLCLAIDFLCHGTSWMAVALTERKAAQTTLAGAVGNSR